MSETLADAAVSRSLRRRRDAAEAEVTRLIETGRELLGSGADPKVGEIVKAARVSNEAFYRYFGSKEQFVAAVVEDGNRRMVRYLSDRLNPAQSAEEQLRTIVAGMFKQAGRGVGRSTRNILAHAGAHRSEAADRNSFVEALSALLAPVVAALGSPDPERDAPAAANTIIGVLQTFLWEEKVPGKADVDHLVDFLVAAVSRPHG